jgi:penicillin-binding protein 1A
VTDVNDRWGLVTVRFAESRGLIDIEDMKWARKPDPEVAAQFGEIKKPSEALKKGDVIQLRVVAAKFTSDRLSKELSDLKKAAGKKKWERPVDVPDFDAFAEVALEQEPLVEGGLLAIDNASGDLLAMVGGYDFARSQFNRTLQALRQTGSSFKVFVYTAALDKGYSPATPITDAPLVFEEEGQGVPLAPDGSAAARPVGAGRGAGAKVAAKPGSSEEPGASEAKVWKPGNYSERFVGDILFRNALIRSLNIPTVKITEKIGLDTVALYARRLGVFSPLNMDFTLALGSSGTTLYEMTKAFAVLARQGRNVHPTLIKKVTDRDGNVLLENLTMDDRFRSEIDVVENEFELYRQAYLDFKQRLASGEDESRVRTDLRTRLQAAGIKSHLDIAKHPPIYFEDKEQLMSPQTAYVITSILQGVVDEPLGTGAAARSVGRPVAAKTGTTSGYFDAWFIGYSPDITSGVWVGYDQERSLGRGETGGRAAIPIWTEFMKASHGANASRSFTAPEGVVFLNIDNDTGRPASATSRNFVRQAFTEGTEPSAEADKARLLEDEKDFFKQDLSQ